jgi:hypothetical protein
MNVVLWLVGLLVLLLAVLLPFSVGTVLRDQHPSMAVAFRLESLAMLVGLVVWQLNEPARLPILGIMAAGGLATEMIGMAVQRRDLQESAYSGASATSDRSLASLFEGGSIMQCASCRKALSNLTGGVYAGSALVDELSKTPYGCKSCGINFCVDCMVKLRNRGGTCPKCRGALGW